MTPPFRVCPQVKCQVISYRTLVDEDKCCPGCGQIGVVPRPGAKP